jgi:hypothetical protein
MLLNNLHLNNLLVGYYLITYYLITYYLLTYYLITYYLITCYLITYTLISYTLITSSFSSLKALIYIYIYISLQLGPWHPGIIQSVVITHSTHYAYQWVALLQSPSLLHRQGRSGQLQSLLISVGWAGGGAQLGRMAATSRVAPGGAGRSRSCSLRRCAAGPGRRRRRRRGPPRLAGSGGGGW